MCGEQRCDALPLPSPAASPEASPSPEVSPGNEVAVWRDYVDAREAGESLPVPDFSYAGYARGERDIPNPDWPVLNVLDYGAVVDDGKDDLAAVRAAVADAEQLDGAIVFFPRGRYNLSEQLDVTESLVTISGSNIIFRGEGSDDKGSVLAFRYHLNSLEPDKKWTTPEMFSARGSNSSVSGSPVTEISASARIGQMHIDVFDASSLNAGDNILIRIDDESAASAALVPYQLEPEWSKLKEGEFAQEVHQIERKDGNRLYLKAPLYMDIDAQYRWRLRKLNMGNHLGFESLRFHGNWHEDFEHHKNIIHDSGWTALKIALYADSWIKDVHFVDWNATVSIAASHSFTVDRYVDSGNRGHSSLHVSSSSGVLVSDSHSIGSEGQFHSFGVSALSGGVVFHRCSWPQATSFDAHASFPHATLFDATRGGFSAANGGPGGSQSSQPNHMENLIFWNFEDLGSRDDVYWDWWRFGDSKYGRYLFPKIVGWHGALARFNDAELGFKYSHGNKVEPESLYEAQYHLRTGKDSPWAAD